MSLTNGVNLKMTTKEFTRFINEMGNGTNQHEVTLTKSPLSLVDLLEKLSGKFPGIKKYPYFTYKELWAKDYALRLNEVTKKIGRTKPLKPNVPPSAPVKQETTGERPDDYIKLRNASSLPYFNLEWVEWRKDNSIQKIGRPSAIIQTLHIESKECSNKVAQAKYDIFKKSPEAKWWKACATIMLVPFYFVVFEGTISNHKIGDHFWVWDIMNNPNSFSAYSERQYAEFICNL